MEAKTKNLTHSIVKVRSETKRFIDRKSKRRGMTRVEYVHRAVTAFEQPAIEQPTPANAGGV